MVEHLDGFVSSSFRNLTPDPSIPIPSDFQEPDQDFNLTDSSRDNSHIYDVTISDENVVQEFTLTERIQTYHSHLSAVIGLELPGKTTADLTATWAFDPTSNVVKITHGEASMTLECSLADAVCDRD